MVPLGKGGRDRVLSEDDASHRSVALRHAAIHDRPGLWGDDAERPSSVVWLREGDDGGCEAFAAGVAGSTPGWLSAEAGGRPIALLAPPSWEGPVRALGGRIEIGIIENWVRSGNPNRPGPLASFGICRLGPEDGPAFEAAVPAWALRSWGDYPALVGRGAAFGVATAGGFASLAWIYESDRDRDKIGVATLPRFRRLGLARAVASALVEHIEVGRRKTPLWVTIPGNVASKALAGSLGFSARIAETLLRWTPA